MYLFERLNMVNLIISFVDQADWLRRICLNRNVVAILVEVDQRIIINLLDCHRDLPVADPEF